MRVTVDFDRCEGHGMCTLQAPEAFSLDDEGELTYRYEGGDVPKEAIDDVQGAINACPVAALQGEP